MSYLRNPSALYGFLNFSAIGSATLYLWSHLVHNVEEHEARMDELESTLRGHIGIIEEALNWLEGKAGEADRGKKLFVIDNDHRF